MKKIKSIILFFVLLISSFTLKAQDPLMADTMRSDGKIYVVVAVASIVVIVISSFMINLDRKVTRIEKKINSKQ